jgi:hypothetical protein
MTESERPGQETPSGSQWRTGIAVLLVLIGVSWLDDVIAIPRIPKVLQEDSPMVLRTGGPFGASPSEGGRDIRAIVANESLDELVTNLYDDDIYIPPISGGKLSSFDVDLENVLRSPRTSKLVDLLSLLPREEALARSRTICDMTRKRWSETFDVVLTSYERPGAPKNKQSIYGVEGAYGTAIFTLAHFADLSEVVAEVRRCSDLQEQYTTRIQNDRDVMPNGDVLRTMFCLDANFRINAIAFALKHGPGSDKSPNPAITDLLDGLPTQRVAYRRWDAPIPPPGLSTSHPYLPEFTAIAAQGRGELEIYYWMHSPYFQRNGERILRELMRLCAD